MIPVTMDYVPDMVMVMSTAMVTMIVTSSLKAEPMPMATHEIYV